MPSAGYEFFTGLTQAIPTGYALGKDLAQTRNSIDFKKKISAVQDKYEGQAVDLPEPQTPVALTDVNAQGMEPVQASYMDWDGYSSEMQNLFIEAGDPESAKSVANQITTRNFQTVNRYAAAFQAAVQANDLKRADWAYQNLVGNMANHKEGKIVRDESGNFVAVEFNTETGQVEPGKEPVTPESVARIVMQLQDPAAYAQLTVQDAETEIKAKTQAAAQAYSEGIVRVQNKLATTKEASRLDESRQERSQRMQQIIARVQKESLDAYGARTPGRLSDKQKAAFEKSMGVTGDRSYLGYKEAELKQQQEQAAAEGREGEPTALGILMRSPAAFSNSLIQLGTTLGVASPHYLGEMLQSNVQQMLGDEKYSKQLTDPNNTLEIAISPSTGDIGLRSVNIHTGEQQGEVFPFMPGKDWLPSGGPDTKAILASAQRQAVEIFNLTEAAGSGKPLNPDDYAPAPTQGTQQTAVPPPQNQQGQMATADQVNNTALPGADQFKIPTVQDFASGKTKLQKSQGYVPQQQTTTTNVIPDLSQYQPNELVPEFGVTAVELQEVVNLKAELDSLAGTSGGGRQGRNPGRSRKRVIEQRIKEIRNKGIAHSAKAINVDVGPGGAVSQQKSAALKAQVAGPWMRLLGGGQ